MSGDARFRLCGLAFVDEVRDGDGIGMGWDRDRITYVGGNFGDLGMQGL